MEWGHNDRYQRRSSIMLENHDKWIAVTRPLIQILQNVELVHKSPSE